MVNNMDELEKHLQRKLQEKKLKHPVVKTFQRALFRASAKTDVLVFACFDWRPCFVDGKMENEIISLSWISAIDI